jgi:hypothetical protein
MSENFYPELWLLWRTRIQIDGSSNIPPIIFGVPALKREGSYNMAHVMAPGEQFNQREHL